jgi:MFS family permease
MYLILALSIAIHSCYIGGKVVISLMALDFGASPMLIGVIAALYALVPLMLGVYTGRLADTVGMRLPLLLGASLVGIAMLVGAAGQSLNALFATALLVGAGFVFFNVSIQNLTGAYGSPEQRIRNFSLLSIGYSISTFIGPMVAGFAIDYAGHTAAFVVFAGFTLVPVVGLTVRPEFGRIARAAKKEEKRSALDLLRMPPVRRLIVTSGLIVAAWDLFAFYLPIYAHSIGISASTIGIILGAYAAAAFLPRFLMPAMLRRWRGDQVLFVAMLVGAAGFAAFPLFSGAYPLVVAAMVIGLGLGCGQPLSMMMSYDRSPAGRTGEVTGLRLTANNLARVVVPVVAGTLGATFGSSPVFWANAVNLIGISWVIRTR